MDSFAELGYLGLFIAAFLAATILPLSSEVVLSALLLGGLSPIALVAIATVGNVLGSLTNYALGYWAGPKVARKWLKISEGEFVRAEQRFAKYGLLSLFCLGASHWRSHHRRRRNFANPFIVVCTIGVRRQIDSLYRRQLFNIAGRLIEQQNREIKGGQANGYEGRARRHAPALQFR